MKVEYDTLSGYIKHKNYTPIVLLHGVESYYVDRLTRLIQDTFFDSSEEQDFNYTLFYGHETTVKEIAMTARQYPAMAPLRLVVVREAQNLNKIGDLLSYVEHPQEKTVLVLSYMEGSKMDGKTALYKHILKNNYVFESVLVYDNQLPMHVAKMGKEKNMIINPQEAKMLAENVGDLARISNELDKLKVLSGEGEVREVTMEMIEKHIGVSREYNVFELKTAVIACNTDKAYAICEYYIANPDKYPGPNVYSILHKSFFLLLNCCYSSNKSDDYLKSQGVHFTEYSFFASSRYTIRSIYTILHLILQYSVAAQGGRGYTEDGSQMLKELVFKIFSVQKTQKI